MTSSDDLVLGPRAPDEPFDSEADARRYVCQAAQRMLQQQNDGMTISACGELACQRDSFARTLDGARPIGAAAFEEKEEEKREGDGKKKGKKNKKKTRAKAEDATAGGGGGGESDGSRYGSTRYVLALTDSIFYPEGGGQPSDAGTIRIERPGASTSIELSVTASGCEGEVCVLTCRAAGEVEPRQVLDALLTDRGASVRQILDWDRRFDLMTQHSAQHLISAISLAEPFGMQTHSFTLSTRGLVSYVDLAVDADVDTDEHRVNIRRVEEMVNEHIRENLPMTPRWLDPSELEALKGGDDVRSRLLPEGITGRIRLVEIGRGEEAVDRNTCCGTHVRTLGQLQMIKFFKLERLKAGIMRVHFAAGPRLMKIMGTMHDRQARLTAMMSCTEEAQVERVSKLLDDRRTTDREIKRLNDRLRAFQVREVAEELGANGNVAVVDVGECDMSYMLALAAGVAENLGDPDDALMLFVGGAESGEEGSFLLTGDVASVDRIGRQVAELLGGRGGGKGGRFQGKGTRIRSALPETKKVLMKEKMR